MSQVSWAQILDHISKALQQASEAAPFWRPVLVALDRVNHVLVPFWQASFKALLVCFVVTESLRYFYLHLQAWAQARFEYVGPAVASGSVQLKVLEAQFQWSSWLFMISLTILVHYILLTFVSLRLHERQHQLSPQNYWQFTLKHVKAVFYASLSVLWRVVLWSFAFFIPGVYKMVVYTFVPYVIFFEGYSEPGSTKVSGSMIDSLDRSSRLVCASWAVFWAVLIYYVLGYLIEAFFAVSLSTPFILYGLVKAWLFGLIVYMYMFLYYLYDESKKV